MAYYNYKIVRDMMPDEYTEEKFQAKYGRKFDGDPNYDGDYWLAAGDYIEDLQNEINKLKEGK